MRRLLAALMGAMTIGAQAAFLVGLDAGDRMAVDSFWVDGDRVHVLRDGLEMSLPRDRVRTLDAAEGSASRPEPGLPAVPGR